MISRWITDVCLIKTNKQFFSQHQSLLYSPHALNERSSCVVWRFRSSSVLHRPGSEDSRAGSQRDAFRAVYSGKPDGNRDEPDREAVSEPRWHQHREQRCEIDLIQAFIITPSVRCVFTCFLCKHGVKSCGMIFISLSCSRTSGCRVRPRWTAAGIRSACERPSVCLKPSLPPSSCWSTAPENIPHGRSLAGRASKLESSWWPAESLR